MIQNLSKRGAVRRIESNESHSYRQGHLITTHLASFGFFESPFAPRKQRIRNFRGAKGDTYFPLDAYASGTRENAAIAAITFAMRSLLQKLYPTGRNFQ